MSFKISVSKELGKDILFEDRDRAGIKTELVLKRFDQALRKDHVADTHRRRERSGEGIQIDDPAFLVHGEKRLLGLCRYGQFRIVVVLDENGFTFIRPSQVLVFFRDAGRNA